eukprot:CAMPEP_0113322498 /NCGR_PEP_ID=MMETSP0010_2-20120614/15652_1 /TAXON_ID=216773 ORGANISM="Corethron hystrix, Strain 308" /NCGR_SAMPLE_ID=MMETSP0010_2 /ASSEMBLY_ACC=CAM_ASM_000155 /LENGTH=176 /DNA_ID=CAMNT_0000181031 /DNA_START=43 /DNA_END=570 /DNA_ORIENTATION=+ /assembly_acc=CAM_ASM_000155
MTRSHVSMILFLFFRSSKGRSLFAASARSGSHCVRLRCSDLARNIPSAFAPPGTATSADVARQRRRAIFPSARSIASDALPLSESPGSPSEEKPLPPAAPRRKKKNNANRFRQHVNPLAYKYRIPISLEDRWYASAFAGSSGGPDAPLVLDIGCAKGKFALDLAAGDPPPRAGDLL